MIRVYYVYITGENIVCTMLWIGCCSFFYSNVINLLNNRSSCIIILHYYTTNDRYNVLLIVRVYIKVVIHGIYGIQDRVPNFGSRGPKWKLRVGG